MSFVLPAAEAPASGVSYEAGGVSSEARGGRVDRRQDPQAGVVARREAGAHPCPPLVYMTLYITPDRNLQPRFVS